MKELDKDVRKVEREANKKMRKNLGKVDRKEREERTKIN